MTKYGPAILVVFCASLAVAYGVALRDPMGYLMAAVILAFGALGGAFRREW